MDSMGRNEIHADGELHFYKVCANLSRLTGIGEGAKDYQNITHASSRTPEIEIWQT